MYEPNMVGVDEGNYIHPIGNCIERDIKILFYHAVFAFCGNY